MSSTTATLCQRSASPGPFPSAFSLRRFEESFDWGTGRDRLDRSQSFAIFWIEQGAGVLQDARATVPFGPGSLLCTAPGQRGFWKLASPARGEIALFTEEFLALGSSGTALADKMPFLFDAPPEATLRLEGDHREIMARMFADLRLEAESAGIGHEDQVRARLTLLLGQARRRFAVLGREQGGASSLASRFRLALAQHFPRVSAGAEYARLLRVSRRQLNEELRVQVGRTASELIRDRCVLEAKRLLVHTTLTISEIGFELRFSDPSYFVRFFHRLTGVTPGRYRAGAKLGASPE